MGTDVIMITHLRTRVGQLFFRAHEGVVESLFGVAAGSWSASGHDGVLEAFTQSHPRVPLEREAAAR